MKYYLTAFLIVAIVVAWFSFYGDTAPYNFPPKQGWAFWGGTEPIVGAFFDGEEKADGEADTFTLEQSETKEAQPLETEETEQDSIFTVSVKQPPVWEYVLLGAAITLFIEEIALCVVLIAIWIKSRK